VNLAGFFGWPTRLNGSGPRHLSRAARKAIVLCRNLLSERGEVSGTLLAGEALAAYQTLDEGSRSGFFDLLAQEFSPDPEKVGLAGDAYRTHPSPENLIHLQAAVESPREELFRRLNLAPGGTRVLVELRGRLLSKLDENPHWEAVVADLERLLIAWFNRGFLELRRIDWRTSALVLEKPIRYEAVHEIQGWNDLRRRLEADRRCYAFFHPSLPDEPIIFIEAALTQGMADKVQPLLDPDSPVLPPESADCAMFYSITNCQEGLRGVPFGSFLIKQVVEDLGREFPRIRKFATVSPVPGFREWLASNPDLADLRTELGLFRRTPPRAGSSLRALSVAGETGPRTARSRRAFSSPQRRSSGAHQLAGRRVGHGDAPLGGSDGELLLPSERLGKESRILHSRLPHRGCFRDRIAGQTQVGATGSAVEHQAVTCLTPHRAV
jgi:Malonyl-CoA decarboxylase C-terminal domain/Malonyl-CoA decarboxylase N-terminal domain